MPALVFYFQAVKLFWRLLAEIQSGTLEQVYLSPLPSWLVAAAGRLAAALAETVLVVAAIYGIISAFVPLRYAWTPAALLPAAALIVTVVGYSLIIGGMTLVWKRIQDAPGGVPAAGHGLRGRGAAGDRRARLVRHLGRVFPVTSAVGPGPVPGAHRRRPVTGLWGPAA